MDKNKYVTVKLAKGEMHVYDFGSIKLHAYKTNDFINNEVFVVEKNNQAVIIESPCFFDNAAELEAYLKPLKIAGMFIAYHGAGAAFLSGVPKYATQKAKEYSLSGGGKALIDNFAAAFGKVFDSAVHNVTNIIQAGKITVGGIKFVIKETDEAFDVEIPEINAVYTHMLGHDCHSIVASAQHANALIARLQSYIAKGYELILTSHYTPEDLNDAKAKIEYLQQLKDICKECNSAEEFKTKVKSLFPEYGGENYLDMTASMFFTK